MRPSLHFVASLVALAAAAGCSRTDLADVLGVGGSSGAGDGDSGGAGGVVSTTTSIASSTSASSSVTTSATTSTGAGGLCGDGIVNQPNEQCDLGAANADRPAIQLSQGALVKAVRPLDRGSPVATFYSYSSASSHTGFEQLQASRVFFYRSTFNSMLSLVFIHGIDQNSSGLSQPPSQVLMEISGLPAGTFVSVADDNFTEFVNDSPTSVHGAWSFNLNSDGGVISSFTLPGKWTVTVAPTFLKGILDWEHVDGDAMTTATPLALDQAAIFQAFDSPAACRTNCTVPTCGDGILDGGEVCDDGNTHSLDGCSFDCKSLE